MENTLEKLRAQTNLVDELTAVQIENIKLMDKLIKANND